MISTILRSFLIFGALLLAASSASATCGDYLHVSEKKSEPTKPAPKPCDGPHCSQRYLPPVPPPSAPPTTFSDDSCCVVRFEMNLLSPRIGWLEIAESFAPHFVPNNVFDPPR